MSKNHHKNNKRSSALHTPPHHPSAAYKLSDPYKDFTCEWGEKTLREIEAKQGINLSNMDLRMVFQSYLPAGSVAENCYYLSPLFKNLNQRIAQFERDDDDVEELASRDLLDGFSVWMHQSKAELLALGRMDTLRVEMQRFAVNLFDLEWDMSNPLRPAINQLCWMGYLLSNPMLRGSDDSNINPILSDIAEDFVEKLLGRFRGAGDCNSLVQLFLSNKENLDLGENLASYISDFYGADERRSRWDELSARYLELGEPDDSPRWMSRMSLGALLHETEWQLI